VAACTVEKKGGKTKRQDLGRGKINVSAHCKVELSSFSPRGREERTGDEKRLFWQI